MGKRVSDNINIGAADIYITPYNSNTEVYLGLTKDGAVFKYEGEYHDITADQYGNMLLDKILIGEKCNCEVKVLDTSKDSIYDTMSTAKKLKDGSIGFGQRPGLRASKHTCKLRIHPVSMGKDNKEYDVIIYTAFNEAGLELAYKKDDEWVIPCNFIGIADLSREDGDLLFRIGEDGSSSGEKEKAVKEIDIAPKKCSIAVGGTQDYSAQIIYTDGSTDSRLDLAKWSSDDTNIIEIDADSGKAIAKNPGTTKITAEYRNATNSTDVTVV